MPSRQDQPIETDARAVLHDTSRVTDVAVSEAVQLTSIEVQQSRRRLIRRKVLALGFGRYVLPACSKKRVEAVRRVTPGQHITNVSFDVTDLEDDKQVNQAPLC